MKSRVIALSMGLLMALAGCGGGGGDPGCEVGTTCGGGGTVQTIGQLRMTLSPTTVNNGAMTSVVATVTALTSSSQAVSGAEVEYTVQDSSAVGEDTGAFIESAVAPTGTDGRTSATVNLGSDKSNRAITVTASAGGRTVSKTINLRGSAISATLTNSVDPLTSQTIVFTVQDSNNAAIEDTPITVEASGLGVRTGQTDSNGSFSYAYTVPNSPGNTLVFTVSAAGVSKQYGVEIKAPASVLPAPVLTGGLTTSLQVNPNVVAINAVSSTANRMQVVANFEDSAGRPVRNVRVSFRLDGVTASAVGGQFSSGPITGSDVQYSDADGKVQTFYIPSTRSSPNNAISVKACFGSTDAEALACSGSGLLSAKSQPITIADEAVSVSIGTDGLLIDEAESLSYAQRFVIKVVNSAGQPKAGLSVSAQINTVNFFKGFYTRSVGDDQWRVLSGNSFQCAKEDLDDDDRLDSSPVNEDLDFDGRLEPIRADVSLTATNGWVTNEDGLVIVKMSYPKNVATWMTINLQATSLVGGSEGRASRQQVLGALIDDVKAEGDPAFRLSPYGVVTSNVTLTANRLMPDNITTLPSGTVLTPCLNPD